MRHSTITAVIGLISLSVASALPQLMVNKLPSSNSTRTNTEVIETNEEPTTGVNQTNSTDSTNFTSSTNSTTNPDSEMDLALEGTNSTSIGPTTLTWPLGRSRGAGQGQGPCGPSSGGPTTRTDFPLAGGQFSFEMQNGGAKQAGIWISYETDPTSNAAFRRLVLEKELTSLAQGPQCMMLPKIMSEDGRNATIQLRYLPVLLDPINGVSNGTVPAGDNSTATDPAAKSKRGTPLRRALLSRSETDPPPTGSAPAATDTGLGGPGFADIDAEGSDSESETEAAAEDYEYLCADIVLTADSVAEAMAGACSTRTLDNSEGSDMSTETMGGMSTGVIVTIILVALVVAAVVMFVVFRYRRKKNNVKNDR